MRLYWRDGLATLFVAIALVTYVAWVLGAELPGFGAVGPVALAVLALGVLASLSAVVPGFAQLLHGSRLYLAGASALGFLAFGAGLWALIAGEPVAVAGLMVATVALWAMSTMRHLALHRPPQPLGHL